MCEQGEGGEARRGLPQSIKLIVDIMIHFGFQKKSPIVLISGVIARSLRGLPQSIKLIVDIMIHFGYQKKSPIVFITGEMVARAARSF